eukprot:601649-Rhodomonas_salina.1
MSYPCHSNSNSNTYTHDPFAFVLAAAGVTAEVSDLQVPSQQPKSEHPSPAATGRPHPHRGSG